LLSPAWAFPPSFLAATNTASRQPTNRFFFTPRSKPVPSPRQPAPGVYEAAPFTAIVVVPHDGMDEGILRPTDTNIPAGTLGSSKMPIITPELRLLPRSPVLDPTFTNRPMLFRNQANTNRLRGPKPK